jgi:hypothetical protein
MNSKCLITALGLIASSQNQRLVPSSCSRINNDGIERYWNGSNCLNALAYGKNCSNSNECQYLTQNTTCNGTICKCSSTQYFNFMNSKCENLLSINETCAQIDACQAGFCFGKPLMCQCLSNEYFDVNTNQCIYNVLTISTSTTTEDLISVCLKINSATTIDGSGFEIQTTP